MKRLGILLPPLPPPPPPPPTEWDASPSQGSSPPRAFCQFSPTIRRYPLIHLGGEWPKAKVKCLSFAQEYNTITRCRARTQTTPSGIPRTCPHTSHVMTTKHHVHSTQLSSLSTGYKLRYKRPAAISTIILATFIRKDNRLQG